MNRKNRKNKSNSRIFIPGVSHFSIFSLDSLKNLFISNFTFLSQFIGSILLLFVVGIAIIFTQWTFVSKRDDNFSVGSPAPETYRVIFEIRHDDKNASDFLRSVVSSSIVGVTVRDVSAQSRLRRRLMILGDNASLASQNINLPEGLVNAITRLEPENRAQLLNFALQIGTAVINRMSKSNEPLNDSTLANSILWEEINKLSLSSEQANLIYQVLVRLGNLNFKVDDKLTDLSRQYAANDVPAIERKLEPGDVIVQRGEIITESIASLLRTQGYIEDSFPVTQLVILILFVLALPLWFDIFSRGSGERSPTRVCVVYVIIIAWVFENLAEHLGIHGAGVLAAVTAAYLCISDYFGFCTALAATSSGVLLISGQSFGDLFLLEILAVIASTIGFYFLRNLESRTQVTRRSFAMAFILTISRMILRWYQGPALTQDSFRLFIPLGEFWQQAGLFFIFEALATHIVLITLPFIEEYLGALSVLTLREISHPSNPLLRDLQRHAPGTYQHSLTIATLIEAVGIEMGMDVNLLRAGAYYHDIGKLRRPQFFVENQGGGFNAHDEMSPMLSAITIISHVKDGLELAWEAKLPKRIRDFIAEHHGTTNTRYFYNKAVSLGENVEWADFCYPGPKPQSRETALLMIVDSVEAAVRAANIRDVQGENSGNIKAFSAIERIVNQVVASKINEGQFDEVHFTQKDLTLVKKTLITVLMSMYHTRKVKKIEKKNTYKK